MSNPFSDTDPDSANESARLWYRDIPEEKSSSSPPASRRFEPPEWSGPGAQSGDWTVRHENTQSSSPPTPVRLRTPRRPWLEGCNCNWLYILIALAIMGLLSGVGYFVWWIQERHVHSSSQMTALTNSINEFRKDLDLTKEDIHDLHSEFNKLRNYVNSVNDTSNLGVYNSMKKMKSELMTDMERNENSLHKELEDSEQKVSSMVSSTTNDMQKMRNNMTTMVNVMNVQLDQTIARINNIVETARVEIDVEIKNVTARQEQYVRDTKKQLAAENDFVTHQLAGTFTLLSCLISLWDITSHLRHYNKPGIQRRVCAILWMVPIYSITSWLALVFPTSARGLGAVRDCYEAYAVYTFVGFLMAIISNEGGWRDAITALSSDYEDDEEEDLDGGAGFGHSDSGDSIMLNETVPLCMEHRRGPSYSSLVDMDGEPSPTSLPRLQLPAELDAAKKDKDRKRLRPPCPCCIDKDSSPRQLASTVIYQCMVMAMQFVLIKPLLAMMPIIFFLLDKPYDTIPMITIENHINWRSPMIYTYGIENLSVMVAFYGLLCFYYATAKNISMYNPWPKFLCIKGVVFVTFWQSVGIGAMCTFGLSTPEESYQIQNFLICIEMLLASIAHYYIFPYEEWEEGYADRFHGKQSKRNGLGFHDSLAFGDFASDMKRLVNKKEWNAETPTGSEVSNVGPSVPRPDTLQKTTPGLGGAKRTKTAAAAPAETPPILSAPQSTTPPIDEFKDDSKNAYSPGDIFGSVVNKPPRHSPPPHSLSHLLAGDDDDDESISEAQV